MQEPAFSGAIRRIATVYLALYFTTLAALFARRAGIAFDVNNPAAFLQITLMLLTLSALYCVVAHRAFVFLALVILWQLAVNAAAPSNRMSGISDNSLMATAAFFAGLSLVGTHRRYISAQPSFRRRLREDRKTARREARQTARMAARKADKHKSA